MTQNPTTKKQIDIQAMRRAGALIDLKGKTYVTYKGLLWVAHQHGLASIEVEMVAWDPDRHEAIMKATIIGSRGTFTEYGDATKQNCGRMMHTCLPRMAATRAKSRALRDYLGIGICSLEELPGDSE